MGDLVIVIKSLIPCQINSLPTPAKQIIFSLFPIHLLEIVSVLGIVLILYFNALFDAISIISVFWHYLELGYRQYF